MSDKQEAALPTAVLLLWDTEQSLISVTATATFNVFRKIPNIAGRGGITYICVYIYVLVKN